MPKIDVTINDHRYTLACGEGEEDHVLQLAAEVEMRAKEVAVRMPRTSEAMGLVMTALMLADELYDARQESGRLMQQVHELSSSLQIAQRQVSQAAQAAEDPFADDAVISREEAQQSLALALDEVAGHVESMSQRLEKELEKIS